MSKKIITLLLSSLSVSSFAAVELTDTLSLSGFASTSWSKSNSEMPLMITRNVKDENCWDCDTTFGLQLDYFNDDLTASAQLVKRPQDNWSDPELEWAYLGYSLTNDIELRAGRLRLPVFLASEYYYVGHAYTTARPPEEVYSSILGITAYNGANLVWNKELYDEYQLSITPFFGFKDDNEIDISDTLVVEVKIQDISGINAQFSSENYKINLAYFSADYDQTFQLTNAIPGVPYLELDMPDRRFELYSFGFEYDIGALKLTGERQLANVRSTWYTSAAYHINKFTPYIVYGETFTKETDITPFDGVSGTSALIGVRYDLKYNLSVNFEWQQFKAKGGQRGPFVSTPQDPDANTFTVMFNYVF